MDISSNTSCFVNQGNEFGSLIDHFFNTPAARMSSYRANKNIFTSRDIIFYSAYNWKIILKLIKRMDIIIYETYDFKFFTKTMTFLS